MAGYVPRQGGGSGTAVSYLVIGYAFAALLLAGFVVVSLFQLRDHD